MWPSRVFVGFFLLAGGGGGVLRAGKLVFWILESEKKRGWREKKTQHHVLLLCCSSSTHAIPQQVASQVLQGWGLLLQRWGASFLLQAPPQIGPAVLLSIPVLLLQAGRCCRQKLAKNRPLPSNQIHPPRKIAQTGKHTKDRLNGRGAPR